MANSVIAAQRVADVEPQVRRVIAARVPSSFVDDLVQDLQLRLVEPASRLEAEAFEAYAVASARNAAASFHRTEVRHRRIEPRMLDLTEPADPASVAVGSEESDALRHAWTGLDHQDRALLHAHHVDDESVGALARAEGRSEMAVRLQLSRARARLRVGYTLSHGNVELPTPTCRPVLLASRLAIVERRPVSRSTATSKTATCARSSLPPPRAFGAPRWAHCRWWPGG